MSAAAKARLAEIDARLAFIDDVLQATYRAAVVLRTKTHTKHLEYGSAVAEMRESLEVEKVGLTAERTKVEIFMDQPVRRAQLRAVLDSTRKD